MGALFQTKEPWIHSDKDMLVCLRECKELPFILISDHCKSDTFFNKENQVHFVIDKHHISEF